MIIISSVCLCHHSQSRSSTLIWGKVVRGQADSASHLPSRMTFPALTTTRFVSLVCLRHRVTRGGLRDLLLQPPREFAPEFLSPALDAVTGMMDEPN